MIPNNLQEFIGLEIEKIRIASGKSRYKVFMDTNIQIGRIERGEVGISPATYFKLCEYFDIPLDMIYTKAEAIRKKKKV